ncbi:kinase-like domain-containing protein [Xylaria flabelliformis]|nr:kinase-like domain-containing protein [Xylaria flabelliformis]
MALSSQSAQPHGLEEYGGTKSNDENDPVPKTPDNAPPPTISDAGQVQLDWNRLDLTALMPEDSPFRVLIQPKVDSVSISAYGGKSRSNNWLEVEVGGESEEAYLTKLFALAATEEHVGCCVTHHDTLFVVYFNVEHAEDHLVLRNRSEHSIYATPLNGGKTEKVKNWAPIELTMGEWVISTSDEHLVEIKVLERTRWPISPSLSTKRSAEDIAILPNKTRISPHLGGVREETLERVFSTNELLKLRRGDKVHIGTGENSYKIKHRAMISDTYLTRVSAAEHSKVPGKLVAIKIIKTANPGEDATVRAAEAWMHETKIRSSFGDHFALAQYFGSDARFHSIYSEYINAKPLMDYRDSNCQFNGNTVRAWRILSDMAAGLSFVHAHNVVHADIKLMNIVFSPVRGAVLVDFSRSFINGTPNQKYGAPWYIPPEFLSDPKSRDKTSDVWALGVVMMWVLGRIPMPESTKEWDVWDLHTDEVPQERKVKAKVRMSEWLNVVLDAKVMPIEEIDEIQEVVNGLVEKSKNDRISAAKLEKQIVASNLHPYSN